MNKEDLKAEAKRLRIAITEMFGTHVSSSQALELIAKAKNYPNWDAACACAGEGVSRPKRTLPHGVLWPDAVTLFAESPNLLRRIIALSSHGGLVLFGGPLGSGKSTSMASVADHVESILDGGVLSVADNPEVVSKLAKRHVALDTLDIREVREKIVVIDEVRERDSANTAVRLALGGHLVLTSIHSTSVEVTYPRFIGLLDDEALAQEIADERQKVLVLHQVFNKSGIIFNYHDPMIRPLVLNKPVFPSIRMNPMKDAAENLDWTIKFLVAAAGITVSTTELETGRKLLAAHAIKGEVTLLELVDAFDRVPELKEWASALRMAALPGPFGPLFSEPS